MSTKPAGFKSPLSQNLKSISVITWHEFKYNLLSTRMMVFAILFGFGTIGSGVGFSYLIIQDQTDVLNGLIYSEPEEVLMAVAAFVSYLGALMVIALAYDSITRERIQGSMDFLLTRPVSKRGIILGKFLGLWFAILTPIFLVMVVTIGLVAYLLEDLPTFTSIAAFFILTALFIGIYINFQQMFSSMSKSITEALITGILIFILYTMFWMIFPYGCAYILGIELSVSAPTADMKILIDIYNLFNPNGAYQSAYSGLIDPSYVDGMHHLVPLGAMILWFFGTLGFNVEVFNRKG